jgi:hypothetical protein
MAARSASDAKTFVHHPYLGLLDGTEKGVDVDGRVQPDGAPL